jgi:hypothetical protein
MTVTLTVIGEPARGHLPTRAFGPPDPGASEACDALRQTEHRLQSLPDKCTGEMN